MIILLNIFKKWTYTKIFCKNRTPTLIPLTYPNGLTYFGLGLSAKWPNFKPF